MKPKTTDIHPNLFRSQLSQIINLSHPLCRLADKINWDRLESNIDQVYGNGCGQPALPSRLLAGLHYLKYTFDESDEDVIDRWVENPYWQYFCGFEQLCTSQVTAVDLVIRRFALYRGQLSSSVSN